MTATDPRARTRSLWIKTLSLGSLAGILATPALAAGYSAAIADNDYTAELARTMRIDYQADASTYLYATIRPTGGAPCAPRFSDDSGSTLLYGESVNGRSSITKSYTFKEAGNWLVCFWFASSSSALPAYTTSQTLTSRSPRATLSLSISPTTARAGSFGTITAAMTSEVQRYLYVSVKAAGGSPCAPRFSDDSGSSVVYGAGAYEGAQTYSKPFEFKQGPGNWLACAYFASSSSSLPLATAQTTFSIPAPTASFTRLVAKGRRVSGTVAVSDPGQLTVYASRGGRTVRVLSTTANSARSVSFTWRRSSAIRAGSVRFRAEFTPQGMSMVTSTKAIRVR